MYEKYLINKYAIVAGKTKFFLSLMSLVLIIIIVLLFYFGYPFSIQNDQDTSNQRLVMMINSKIKQQSNWEEFWKKTSSLIPDKNIINQMENNFSIKNNHSISEHFKKGLIPSGNTFFMRRKYSMPKIDKSSIRGFQAADFANEDDKLIELRNLAKNDNPVIKYRAYLEILRFKLKSKKKEHHFDIEKTFRLAKNVKIPDEKWKSDIYFLSGHYYSIIGKFKKAKKHLETAIKLDPYYLDARWAMIKLLLNYIIRDKKILGSGNCLNIATQILSNIEKIAVLARDKKIFFDIADELQNVTYNSTFKYLAVGYCYYFAGDETKARYWLEKTKHYTNKLSRYCGIEVQKKANWLIQQMDNL